ncbi:MAG: hypothetical protein WBP59_05030 [Ilumatobacteraceae bacterium]
MTIGYDPDRVRRLGRLTLAAIDECARIRSTDPAATDALRAIALTRRNLEDLWMPAVRAIEQSQAMTSWTGIAAAGLLTPLSPLTDREFIDELTWMDHVMSTGEAPPDGDLAVLASELARRTDLDADLDTGIAAQLARLARSSPLIGLLAARGEFSPAFLERLAVALATPIGPFAPGTQIRQHRALETVLTALVDEPGSCLDVLLADGFLEAMATRSDLDPTVVTEFLTTGLHRAVADDASRLADSYTVLAQVTSLANSTMDDGLPAPIALGVAASMIGWVDTLAPAILHEGDARVRVEGVDLGSYRDLTDLIGALLRDTAAQASLGVVLGSYTTSRLTAPGTGVDPAAVSHIARFADLVADAARTEHAELVMTAAADEARLRRFSDVVGFGIDAVLTASGVGSAARAVTTAAVEHATKRIGRVDVAPLPDARIPTGIYDLVTIAAITAAIDAPSSGPGAVPISELIEVRRRVTAFHAEGDPTERADLAQQLRVWVELNAPAVAGVLHAVQAAPGMDELTEDRDAVGTD